MTKVIFTKFEIHGYINKINFKVRTQRKIFRKMLQLFCLFVCLDKFGGIKNKMPTEISFLGGLSLKYPVKSVKPAYNRCFKNSEVDHI